MRPAFSLSGRGRPFPFPGSLPRTLDCRRGAAGSRRPAAPRWPKRLRRAEPRYREGAFAPEHAAWRITLPGPQPRRLGHCRPRVAEAACGRAAHRSGAHLERGTRRSRQQDLLRKGSGGLAPGNRTEPRRALFCKSAGMPGSPSGPINGNAGLDPECCRAKETSRPGAPAPVPGWRYRGLLFSGGEGGIRTPGRGLGPYDGLANRCFRPLSHLSATCVATSNLSIRRRSGLTAAVDRRSRC